MKIAFRDGGVALIEWAGKAALRIRVSRDGKYEQSLLERFGLIDVPQEEEIARADEGERVSTLRLGDMCCLADRNTGKIFVFDVMHGGDIIFSCRPVLEAGAGALIPLNAGERLSGLGYRKTDKLDLRGGAYRNHVTYGAAYGPQPMLMSSAGYGLYLNAAADSYFDIGAADPDVLKLWSDEAALDLFVFFGGPAAILDAYTALTGRPYLMPEAGYGLMFITNEKETQFDILNDAERFRSERLPCAYIGLEPGWMETHYDATTDKKWNRERFYMPWWSDDRKQFREATFIGALRRKQFGLSLWLCCDYDVFWEEERSIPARTEDNTDSVFTFGGPDFDLRAHTPIYLDKITKRDEPWFEHLKKFIDDGVTAFKQDPAYVVNDHPDRLYAGRYRDRDVHNIYVTVLAKQVHMGYREYTGERPMHYTGAGYTGIQRWAPSWTCDCGGREDALMGVLLSSICGHMNVTCDLNVNTLEGLHFGFLLPWSQINSWAEVLHPWHLDAALYEAFRFYANLHDSLFPYLYAYAHVGNGTGMPILRAMPLCYPRDPESYEANRQYLLGDSLLVGAFTRRVYLPEGVWFDYWTGERLKGGRWVDASWPVDRGGPLYVRKGGILLSRPDADGVDYLITLYPGDGSVSLYEDDGHTFAYETGGFALTAISCVQSGDVYDITVGPREGGFQEMKPTLTVALVIKGDTDGSFCVNGKPADTEALKAGIMLPLN